MPSIIISDKKFSYVVNRKSIGSLSLRIKSRRSFVVSVPHLVPGFIITKFIKDHQKWILFNSAKFSLKKSLKNIKNINILGQEYEIIIKKTIRDSVVIFKNEQKIYINTVSLFNSHLQRLIDAKFRPFALSLINQELRLLSTQYGFNYQRVSIKNTITRFGSCSSTNNLNFNWQIIFFPVEIFRHILLHELTHTIHHNHSSNFWKQLALSDPNWRLNRHFLKTKGQKLFII